MKYIAKKDTWFDEGTECKLLVDCSPGVDGSGVYEGFKDGKLDEELCGHDEFEIIGEE